VGRLAKRGRWSAGVLAAAALAGLLGACGGGGGESADPGTGTDLADAGDDAGADLPADVSADGDAAVADDGGPDDAPPGDIPGAGPPACSARAHGATGDGTTLDTAAIQTAVDACAGTGGTVVLEAGTYLSGTVVLQSRMTFRLEAGATLLGSQAREDWTGAGLLVAEGAEDLVLEGPGTVDGNGLFWWVNVLAGEDHWRPERLVRLTDCRRVTVRDLFLTQSPKWTLHLLACDDVVVDRVRIRNTVGDSVTSPNTDGIDIDACRRVDVGNCDIETGDDCIVLKNGTPGWQRESYDVRVHDCTCAAWANGFKIGTRPGADIHGVVFEDSVVQATVDSMPGTRVMGGLTLVSDDGARVYDVTARNLHMKAVQAPFFLRVQERDLSEEGLPPTQAGQLYRVTIRDVTVDDALLPGMILGIPGHPVGDVTLQNVAITNSHGGTVADRDARPGERNLSYPDAPYFGTMPAYGLFARHVSGPLALLADVPFASSAAAEARAAVVLEDVAQRDLSGVAAGTEVVDRDAAAPP
jgi:polygalacturonase